MAAPMLTSPTADSKTLAFSSSLHHYGNNFVPQTSKKSPRFSTDPQELLEYYLGNKEEDGEIGVFQAEKYFNGVMDHQKQDTVTVRKEGGNFHHKNHQQQDIVIEMKRPPKSMKPCTPPSIVSESSVNSQSALLKKSNRNTTQRKIGRHHGCRGFLSAAICCKCSVSASGSASVDRKLGSDLAPVTTVLEQRQQAKNKNSLRLGPTVAMLNSEFTARKEEFETESNASSDLFEIESLTGKVRSQQISDANSDFCADVPAASNYAPSEVSIQWSVITASAADFDDVDGRRKGVNAGCAVKNDGDGVRKRLGGGALLGCKSQKAVRVAGDALRSVSGKYGQVVEERRRVSSSVRNPVARFQAETKLAGFDGKYGKRGSQLLYVGI